MSIIPENATDVSKCNRMTMTTTPQAYTGTHTQLQLQLHRHSKKAILHQRELSNHYNNGDIQK